MESAPLELEKALLFDFVLQNPRLFLAALTDLDPVLRAYGLQDAGISEFFAQRRLETSRERFQATVSALVARDLLHEDFTTPTADSAAFRLTEAGREVATLFTSEMAQGIRAVATVTCSQWRRRNNSELYRVIRHALPDQASEAARLTHPFAAWLLDVE